MNHFFGQNLKTIRLENKLSQAELGKHLHKGQKTVGNWETGYSEPCMDDLIRISELFLIGIDPLLKNEIKRNTTKVKAGRNRHNEPAHVKEKGAFDMNGVKRALQAEVKQDAAKENAEITWRDKYISVLETHLFETISHSVSEESVQVLMTKVLSLQRMVAELAGAEAAR